MIAADRAQLAADMAQMALMVRKRELQLFVSNLHKLHTAAALLASFCYMFVMFNIGHWQMDAMSGMSGGMTGGGGGMSGGGGMGPMPGPAPMPGMPTPAPMPGMPTPAPMPGMPTPGPMPGTYTSLDQNDPLFVFIWLCVLGLCANLGVAAIATTLAVVLPEQALYGSAADVQHALLLLRRQVLVLTRLFLFAIACVWAACAVLPWAHNVYGGEEAKGGDTGKAAALSVLCATLLAACLGVSWHEWQNYGATSGVMHEGGGEGAMEGMDELLQRVVEK